MVIQDVDNSLYRLRTTEEVNSLNQYCSTQGDTPWNPSSFSDQVADKFYQQVIDNEQKNSLNTKYDYSYDINVELVENSLLSCHTSIHLMHMIQMSKENMQI
jgi:hypothetical protein